MKAPQGYSSKGPGNMQSMIKQAQKMQEDMRQALQAQLDERNIPRRRAAARFQPPLTASTRSSKLDIKPEVVGSRGCGDARDLVTAAVNEAIRQAVETSEAEMGKVTGGLNMPGLF